MVLLCTNKIRFMRKIFLLSIFTFCAIYTQAQKKDTLKRYEVEEVVVRASTKETNNLRKMPSATSVITPAKIAQSGIVSIKDISTLVPNLYIPDYGSKMTTPFYLRGVGTRSSGQSVGVYVDNIPYMDKSTLDFELMDVQRIEVLRGPQGTLYGRNAMGGIINIYTQSPLDYQGTKVMLGIGNYGESSVRASNYSKLSDRVGISVGGYYDRSSGYFTNEFTGNKVDKEKSAGGHFKLDLRLSNRWMMKLSSSFDYTDQGAFAYGMYHKDTKVIDPVNYNDEGSYKRKMTNNNLRFEYKTDKVLFSSNTGYQYLNDDMRMDQDFTNQSIFTINQRQRQNSFSQEFVARSMKASNYQWSVGAFGFSNSMRTNGDVVFKEDGIKDILQPVFDKMMPPSVPVKIKINDTEIPNPGTYKTPSYGLALFHQSTVNNLFTEGLSLTVGLRVDYEKQWLDYNTSMSMNTTITSPMMPRPIPYNVAKTLTGDLNQDFIQVLPKVSLKYECTDNIMTYATVSKGYKAGGYNIQMFSEVIQDSLKQSRPSMPGVPTSKPSGENTLSQTVSYKPEITWNYEIGMRGDFFDKKLHAELALFYMNIQDLQLTQFVTGGSGRMLSNAGKGRSMGAEVSLTAMITKELTLDANYGYTHATFTNYNDGKNDYKGKYVPYTPRNTFSVAATYSVLTGRNFIQQVSLTASYNGCGNIYWTEMNDIEQPFYGLLNAKLSLRHKGTRLEIWGRNLTCEKYGAFYFESFGKSFVQRGKPLTFGANLIFTI